MGGFGLHNILPALRVKVTALHQHGEHNSSSDGVGVVASKGS
jgi:hypothetical protein